MFRRLKRSSPPKEEEVQQRKEILKEALGHSNTLLLKAD